jgi:PAS domain S-box-containing protein
VLFALDYFSPELLRPLFHVSILSAAVAAVAAVTAVVLRFWAPHEHLRELSTVSYIMLVILLGSVVLLSGELISPFGALLAGALMFSGYFGIAGSLVALGAVVAAALWQLFHGKETSVILQEIAVAGLLPYIVSIVLWSKDPSLTREDTTEDKSYHELASQLSQVAGKSDVVINAIGDGVIALNAKGHIELINPAAQRIIGWGKQDALGLDYKSVLKLVDAKNTEVQDINSPIEKALHENKPFDSDVFSLVTNSGKTVLASIVASPIGQTGAGVIVVFRDITSEKAEERQQAEFISTASHEMRTPVASIEGYLGLALNPATATVDEKARDFINKAHASAQHLGRLFQDLLDVSRADDGRLANNPKVVDIVPYIQEISTGLRPKAEEKGLRFIYKPVPDDVAPHGNDRTAIRSMTPVYYANVDNDHLREIVSNLIENAIKYTPSGDIVIDVSGDESKVIISVADTGLGIPAEDQSHLFQKFYRVDNTDTREIGGTGLGLYLCRRLAETIGGRLWVESEYKKGSTFYLEVPRVGHEEATHLIEQASIEAERAAASQPTPEPEPIPSTYVAAPAEPPVQQIAPPPQAPTPQAPPAMPQQPQYVPQQQPQFDPSIPTPSPAAPQNTPISAIEANPRQYIQPRDPSITIPDRNQ